MRTLFLTLAAMISVVPSSVGPAWAEPDTDACARHEILHDTNVIFATPGDKKKIINLARHMCKNGTGVTDGVPVYEPAYGSDTYTVEADDEYSCRKKGIMDNVFAKKGSRAEIAEARCVAGMVQYVLFFQGRSPDCAQKFGNQGNEDEVYCPKDASAPKSARGNPSLWERIVGIGLFIWNFIRFAGAVIIGLIILIAVASMFSDGSGGSGGGGSTVDYRNDKLQRWIDSGIGGGSGQ